MKRFELSRYGPVVATAILKVARDLRMGKISTGGLLGQDHRDEPFAKNRNPFLPCATGKEWAARV